MGNGCVFSARGDCASIAQSASGRVPEPYAKHWAELRGLLGASSEAVGRRTWTLSSMEVWAKATQSWHSLLCKCSDPAGHLRACIQQATDAGDHSGGNGVQTGQDGGGPDDLELLLGAAEQLGGNGGDQEDRNNLSATGIRRR